jgi:hypothetical protein
MFYYDWVGEPGSQPEAVQVTTSKIKFVAKTDGLTSGQETEDAAEKGFGEPALHCPKWASANLPMKP